MLRGRVSFDPHATARFQLLLLVLLLLRRRLLRWSGLLCRRDGDFLHRNRPISLLLLYAEKNRLEFSWRGRRSRRALLPQLWRSRDDFLPAVCVVAVEQLSFSSSRKAFSSLQEALGVGELPRPAVGGSFVVFFVHQRPLAARYLHLLRLLLQRKQSSSVFPRSSPPLPLPPPPPSIDGSDLFQAAVALSFNVSSPQAFQHRAR